MGDGIMAEISNLGIDASIRFAHDQEMLDRKYITETSFIRPNAEVDVTTPIFSSEYDQLFKLGTQITFASFEPPENFFVQKKQLFTTQLAPSLGPSELEEGKIDKIRSAKLTKTAAKSSFDFSWQAEREKKDRETEQTKLVSMLETVHLFNRYLLETKARIGQYKKG